MNCLNSATKLKNPSLESREWILALKSTGIFLVLAEVFHFGLSTASFFFMYPTIIDTYIELVNQLFETFVIGYGPAMAVVGSAFFAVFSLYLIKISFISDNFRIAGFLGITVSALQIVQVIIPFIDPRLFRVYILLNSVLTLIYIGFVVLFLLALMELSHQINSSFPFLMGFLAIIFVIIRLPLGLLLMTHFSVISGATMEILQDGYFLALWFEINYFFDSLSAMTLMVLGVYLVDLAEKTNEALNMILTNKEVVEKLKNLNEKIDQLELESLSRQLNINKLELKLILNEINRHDIT